MDARKVAAQFAAFTWFQDKIAGPSVPAEATRFANENWSEFLTIADEGWGRLLIRLFEERECRRRRHRRPSRVVAIGA